MTSYHPEDIRNEYCGNCHKTRGMIEVGKDFELSTKEGKANEDG